MELLIYLCTVKLLQAEELYKLQLSTGNGFFKLVFFFPLKMVHLCRNVLKMRL